MISNLEMGWIRPDNRRLLIGIAVLQVLLIALPGLWGTRMIWLPTGLLIATSFVLFSVQRTLLVLLLLNIILPSEVLKMLILPGGFRFQEGLFLAALLFAIIDLVYRRNLKLQSSAADLPVLFFLLITALSVLIGFWQGNLTSVILRDARFPFYYVVFFLVVNFANREEALERFLPVLVLATLGVGFEYILEFLGAIDLSVGSRFVRVARLQGIALPLVLIFLVNQFIHDPQRYGRWVLLALFIPISLAFVLTVGRGMWVSFGIGLIATVGLWHLNRPAEERKVWQAVLLIFGLVAAIAVIVLLFQRVTGSAVGAHALERSRTFVDVARDVHVVGRISSYLVTFNQFLEHPLLGSGQGATLFFFGFNEEFNRFEINEAWTVDSLYLALLWKTGLVGLIAFGWMVLRVLRIAYRTYRSTDDPQVRAFMGGTTAMIVGMASLGLSDASMISGRFTMVFGTLFGMIAVVAKSEDREMGSGASNEDLKPVVNPS